MSDSPAIEDEVEVKGKRQLLKHGEGNGVRVDMARINLPIRISAYLKPPIVINHAPASSTVCRSRKFDNLVGICGDKETRV
jgi:hypothetical protein